MCYHAVCKFQLLLEEEEWLSGMAVLRWNLLQTGKFDEVMPNKRMIIS